MAESAGSVIATGFLLGLGFAAASVLVAVLVKAGKIESALQVEVGEGDARISSRGG